MKSLLQNSFLPLLISAFILSLSLGCSDKTDVLIVTGGHAFDTTEFFSIFFPGDGISVDTVSQPLANSLIEKNKVKKWDAVVFYDMWQDITNTQKEGYLRLLENGTGLIFLHHSLVSYQDWDEFTAIRGGKYYEKGYGYDSVKLSGYEHDLDLRISLTDQEHPITKDIPDFKIHDEGYNNVEILSDVTPLLQTSHPLCASPVAWTNEFKNSRIVYIMLGHDREAYSNPSFRKLINNSINWVSHND